MAILNQYSYVFWSVVGGIILAIGLWLWKGAAPALRAALLAAYLLGAVGMQFVLRYRDGEEEASTASVEETLANGRPTFLMLYSNF
jgi:hypothetical protein